MSDSTPLQNLSASQSKKEVTINEDFGAVWPAACFGLKHYPIGLTVELYGGTINVSGTPTNVYDPDGYSDDIDDDSTIYIRVNASGVVSWVNAGDTPAPHPGWPAAYSGYTALYEMVTAGGIVTSVDQWRTAGGSSGGTGGGTLSNKGVVFADATPSLQTNVGTTTALLWDDSQTSLKIGTSSTAINTYALHTKRTVDGDSGLYVENVSTGTSANTALTLRNSSTAFAINKWGASYSGGGGDSHVAHGASVTNAGVLGVGTSGANALLLVTNGTTRVVVDSGAAKFGVGTTASQLNSAPADRGIYNLQSIATYIVTESSLNTGYSGILVRNNSGDSGTFVTTGSTFSTSGIFQAANTYLVNYSANDLWIANSVSAKSVIIVAGGSATTDEICRFNPTTGVTVKSGARLTLGNAATTGLSAGALAGTTNASIVLYDSTGQAYRVPCII